MVAAAFTWPAPARPATWCRAIISAPILNGSLALGNAGDGVDRQWRSGQYHRRGQPPGQGNLLSGNSQGGVGLKGAGADSNLVQGNLIGTDASGTAGPGEYVFRDHHSQRRQQSDRRHQTATRNVISANNLSGVYITTNSTGNLVQGNYIGVDATGRQSPGQRGQWRFDQQRRLEIPSAGRRTSCAT